MMATSFCFEEIERAVGRWNPSDVAYAERMDFQFPLTGSPTMLLTSLLQRRDLVGSWPDDASPFHRVILLFEGVRDLNLHDFGMTPQRITGFQIHDISARGLENLHFEIEDYENNCIAFKCSTISVIGVEPARIGH